ncbi:serine/threonine protein kinase [Paractinoplanes rishiriensis]|uniref:non-specific serine/threonine protein kinase n=1 Tax=Paractinoplanes rishiriensis TaxID=1050105 RepID=A0A919K6R3_9ACTN|nr:protein kinase [Actinoplanes rishiriensis]GIF01099.1 hypothetical protein Ari01nite_85630 [Actinoplanes rishiriensis]
MKPIFDNNLNALIAAYGEVRESPSSPDRGRRIADLIADLCASSGLEPVQRPGDLPVLALRHEGATVLIVAVSNEHPMTCDEVRALVGTARDPDGSDTVVVLSMSGFDLPGTPPARVPARTVLWDGTHLEAALCGLLTMPDLLESSLRSAQLHAVPGPTLAASLTTPETGGPARMRTPDLLPPPWPLFTHPSAGVPAQLALVGEDGWERSSGIAALDENRLLITTAAGLVQLDTAHGTTSWLIRLPGCVNDALVQPDGSVLVVCHHAIGRVSDGAVVAVAGGFTGDVHLIAGPDGDTWVLSGIGHMYGPQAESLALTRIGDQVGQQHRYDIDFPANVHTAGWLTGRKFFIAAAGHCAVIDLDRRTTVIEEDWIESPHAYRAHLVVAGPRRVITASGSHTGLGVALTSTDPTTRSNRLLAEITVNAVHGLCTTPGGSGYLWGDVHAGRHGSHDPWPVLVRLPKLVHAGTNVVDAATGRSSPAVDKEPAMPPDPYDAVRQAASGDRKAYALDPKPIDDGGQAVVFGARHKPTGIRVAFKKRSSDTDDAVARMKREVDIAHALGDNPHVMPVLDHGAGYKWFVMPLADNSAATCRQNLSTTEGLRELVTAICDGLRPAHQLGWIHRDLKPANLLHRDGVWAVADWGLGRRPRGQTTDPRRTRVGAPLGTEGFAAPELSTDAHQAGPAADIYSIGQIIGWAIRGTWPLANIPLLPDSGPWRHIAKQATQHDPARRPATVDALLELIRTELDHDQPDSSEPAQQLLTAANDGDDTAASDLFALAARHVHDLAFHSEILSRLDGQAIHAGVASDPARAREIVVALREHLTDSGQLHYTDADRIITFLHHIQVWAAEAEEWDLLQDTAETVLAWDERWDQWTPQKQIRLWMASLSGDAAAVVAGALRREPGAARHFEEILENRRVDERIRRAVRL